MRKSSGIKKNKARQELTKDFTLVFLGAVIAFSMANLGIISWLVNSIGNQIISSFLAGIFFTSVFTIAPASVALVSISSISPMTVAFWGALGAMCGDLILFFFIRDRFADDVIASVKPSVMKHILSSFHLGFMKWLSPILGALIIASPLPDEFGLTLLGLSRTKISILIPISLVMNFTGIYLLLRFAQASF
ncbi:MAG: hypothetical protein WCS89_03665 [Candidatus Paceibacterota bacterium]